MITPDRRQGTERTVLPQERIAGFLRQQRIAVIPAELGKIVTFSFMQYPPVRDKAVVAREVAKIQYDMIAHGVLPADPEEIKRRLQHPGLIGEVVKPFITLLGQEHGDFYGQGFEMVHDAIDSVEATYDPNYS